MSKEKDIKANLQRMMIGSCSCMTKTPDDSYHYVDCKYRQLNEAYYYIVELEDQVRSLRNIYESDKPR
jgi:hypothetical protein